MTMKTLMTHFLSNSLSNGSNSSSLVNASRKIVLSALLGSATLIGSTIAQAAQTTIPIDFSGISTTKHEIAVLQVLAEVCPPMLNRQQRDNFQRSYNQQLRQMLPTVNNPRAAVRYLSTQQDYKAILASMRNWTLSYSREENLALCNDLASASF